MLSFEPVGVYKQKSNFILSYNDFCKFKKDCLISENELLLVKEVTNDVVLWIESCENGVITIRPNIFQNLKSLSDFLLKVFEETSNFYELVCKHFDVYVADTSMIEINFIFNDTFVSIPKIPAKEQINYAVDKGLVLSYCGCDKSVAKAVSEKINPMKFKNSNDEHSWNQALVNETTQKNTLLAEKWAKFIQFEMENGISLIEAAYPCLMEISKKGINGVQYVFMMYLLRKHWVFGEELNNWHFTFLGKNYRKQ